ncbi:serine hydrolase [Longimicrobium sp.]|jgi:CubicO group peptidase (beta-lactamase class C family)|uniref:serine hydrolase n=1 Tax=Longimicrobium sp. TaxID=2029185 RepID=UPI002F93AFB2
MPRFSRSFRALALCAFLAAPVTTLAQAVAASAPVVDPSLAGVDSMLAAAYPAGGPGAAVIVARGDRVLMRKAYGMADIELGVPMRPEHVFRLGSITKQFTAVATLMLADDGKLSLDDDITRFFPDYPTHGRRITVEHLLTHTSGIRSYTSIPEWRAKVRTDVTPAELIAAFRDQPMDFAPGEDWRYNNSGYALLGALIEQVSGQGYADFLRTRLFEPLGMTNTRVETQTAIIPRRVRGYQVGQGRAITNSEYLSLTHPYSAGALVSTVDDMLRWGQSIEAEHFLKPETWRRALTAFALPAGRGSGYGYGWFLSRVAGEPSVEHGGDINGFSTHGMFIPSQRLHVYVLSNAERNFANPETFAVRIAERLMGRAAPAFVTLPAAELDGYVGVYRVTEDERRVVTRDGERMFLQRGRGGTRQEIRALGSNEFINPNTGTRFTFLREGGRVTGLLVRGRIGPEEPVSPRTNESPADALAPLAPRVAVPAAVLDRYAGEYQLAPNFVITIRREGDGLKGRATGQGDITLVAQTETRFAAQEVQATVEFERDASGAVTRLILTQGGRTLPAPKIK